MGNQVVMRFDLEVDAGQLDAGTKFSGSQTDTFQFNEDPNELRLTRTQSFGGVDSSGAAVNYYAEGSAILRPD